MSFCLPDQDEYDDDRPADGYGWAALYVGMIVLGLVLVIAGVLI